MKLTYRQQLEHPNWQRRRLELLQSAGWECQDCGEKDTQLHIHHRQYFKDRMAWEYEDNQLVVLCKFCHEIHDFHRENLKEILSRVDQGIAVALLAGFFKYELMEIIGPEEVEGLRQLDPTHFAVGLTALFTSGLQISGIYEIAKSAIEASNPSSEMRPRFEGSRHNFGDF